MKNYISELKKVTWPKSAEVNQQFWITLFGIIFLILFFIASDSIISQLLSFIYNQ